MFHPEEQKMPLTGTLIYGHFQQTLSQILSKDFQKPSTIYHFQT